MSKDIKLYRKRIIPNETIFLKDDIILHYSNNFIITKWNTLKPRKDIDHGISAYFIDQGFKISKIFDCNHQLVYWYCDIISTTIEKDTHTYIFEDLILDIIVYEDGTHKIMDLPELSMAIENNRISPNLTSYALQKLDQLLNIIYEQKFFDLVQCINEFE